MPEVRTLPIAAEHREFTVKAGGSAVPRQHQLASVSISLVANRIASAQLTYVDGAATGGGFALAAEALFKPGQEIEISAGAGAQQASLFKGKVVRQGIKVREHASPQLVVDCRHGAFKLAAARRNATFFDQTDSEIIDALISGAGLTGDVESTSVKHKQMVQFHASDWDFLIARARANGKLVWAEGDKLVVKAPSAAGAAACTLAFGATLLEFDAELDSRGQYSAVKGISWDPAAQELLSTDGQTPDFAGPGDLSGDDLAAVAAVPALELRHAALAEGEAAAWASAVWQYGRVNKLSGRGKCEGIGSVKPGSVVELAGLGPRYNGKVLVSGVRHQFDLVGGWKTHIQFGGLALDGPETASAPPAAGLNPAVSGLQVGVVVSNEDPDGEHRVRIRLPLVEASGDGIWARVASLDAGDQRGFFFRPEIGDEVVAGFLEADPRHPVILGMLHSSAKAAPLQGSDDNHEKLYKSRSGMRVYFNDDKKVMTLDTPAGNSITLSEDDKSIVLADQNGNKITLNSDGIKIESAKATEIKAGTEAKLESGTAFSAKGGTELKLEGATQAELSGGAATKVKGGVVQIN